MHFTLPKKIRFNVITNRKTTPSDTIMGINIMITPSIFILSPFGTNAEYLSQFVQCATAHLYL